jgi:MMPL family
MVTDYTLFLLARYAEEYHLNTQVKAIDSSIHKRIAIQNMLPGSGNVLILSGLTLATTFVGLTLLPLRNIGIGALITILSALVCNLYVVPILLLTKLGDLIIIDDINPNTDNENNNQERSEDEASSRLRDHPLQLKNDISEVNHLTKTLLHERDAKQTNRKESDSIFCSEGKQNCHSSAVSIKMQKTRSGPVP